MSAFLLKLIAITAMAVDHIGATIVPMQSFRIIGRLTMPIMCYFIGEGYRHTRDVKKYMGRLLLFAFLSEIPFDLAMRERLIYPYSQNVFFTLFLGLLGIYLFERYRSGIGGLAIVLCGVAANLFSTDYGFFGVLLITALYLYGQSTRGLFLVLVGLNLLFYWGTIQMYSALAFIPLALYNGERGPNIKYLFYVFYPAHLLILYLLQQLPVFSS